MLNDGRRPTLLYYVRTILERGIKFVQKGELASIIIFSSIRRYSRNESFIKQLDSRRKTTG